MKRLGLLLATLGLFGCIGLGAIRSNAIVPVYAEGDEVVEVADTKATVILEKVEHGKIEASILEGNEGDICELNVKAELLYVVKNVAVNGTPLIEDENISGLYRFVLVKGENIISVAIEVDQELLGELSTIYDQARNKDWTNLFTVENLIHLVKWVLDCGILLAMVRYFIRDKKLADKVENTVKKEINKIIPETTKNTVVTTVQEVVQPLFAQLKADNVELTRAIAAFAKCMALAQENTPESRTAIIDILSSLNISDEKTLADAKAYIDKLFADHIASYNQIMDSLKSISDENKKIAGEEEPVKEEEPTKDDGTSI